MNPYFNYPLKLPGILMLLALVWLTMGTLYADHQKQQNKIISHQSSQDDCEQNSSPFDTEKKTETFSNDFIQEDLQTDFDRFLYPINPLKHTNSYKADAFIIFHGELFSPPPESLC
jgi:hypothetical protein